jgi:hypothetical protein
MGMFHSMKVGDLTIDSIDWEMTPEWTFGTFESWGGRERIRNNNERIYYFYIDNWGDEPKLCLMERGVKHARIVAEIKAPADLVKRCVNGQGEGAFYDRNFAIDEQIRNWLIEHVLDDGDGSLVRPIKKAVVVEDMGRSLPRWDGTRETGDFIALPAEPAVLDDDQVVDLITSWNFFDAEVNPGGRFVNHLHDSGRRTIVDQRTGLMWQSGGLDIASLRTINRGIIELNRAGFAGFHDWRLPSLAEAMSLLEPMQNDKELYLDSNFSGEQPFVFVAGQRHPGGYWFVDFKQGRAFWSSGTIPGGFGRLCRSLP